MKKRLVKALIASAVMSSLMITTVFATPSVDELKNQKAATENEVNDLQTQLNKLMDKVNELENKLIKKGQDLTKAKKDLVVAEEKQKKQYEDMKLRIQYMYEEGDSSALERVAASGSIAEILNQMEYVQKVHTYDRNKLHEYEETVQEVEDLKTTLEKDKKKLENLQTEYEAQSQELSTTIESKSSEIENLDVMIQEAARAALEAQKEIERKERYERDRQAREQQQQQDQQNQQQQPDQDQNQQPDQQQPDNTDPGTQDEPSSGGDTSTPEPSYNAATGNAVVDRAYGWVGKASYVWGACSPGAFDCSGFVSYCLTGSYSRLGTTYTFLAWPQTSNPQPGDVCVNASHCGIYIGGGQMIHAATEGVGVVVGPVQGGMIYVRY